VPSAFRTAARGVAANGFVRPDVARRRPGL